MIDFWYRLLTLSKWGMQALWGEWFVYVTIPLLMNLVISAYWMMTRRQHSWRREYFIVFLPLLAYPAIAFVGAIAWESGIPVPPFNHPAPNVATSWSVLILNVASIIVGILMVFRMKSIRWFSVSISLSIQWILQGINLIVSMPIGGVWV